MRLRPRVALVDVQVLCCIGMVVGARGGVSAWASTPRHEQEDSVFDFFTCGLILGDRPPRRCRARPPASVAGSRTHLANA